MFHAKNPGYWRQFRGIPEPSRAEPEKCECCGRADSRGLNVDHCHGSGRFRGWLCKKCNMAVGLLGDTLEGVNKMVTYMENTE